MLKRIQTQDQSLQLIQDNVDTALTNLQKSPLTAGKILSDISLTSGVDNLIVHNLGYVPRLAFPMLANVDTRIWNPVTASLNGTSASNEVINLRCSATCIVSIWIT